MVTRTARFLMMLTAVLTLAACGGGSTQQGNQPATVAGAVAFPPASTGKQTAKQSASLVTVTSVTIEVRSVETGQVVPGVTVKVEQDNATIDQNAFSYSVSGITPNRNYVFKATRGNQVVRRYIPSTVFTSEADKQNQTVDAVSTATVIIIQTKLNLPVGTTLGEKVLPSGITTIQINDIKPALLDSTIRTQINDKTGSYLAFFNSVNNVIASGADPVSAPTDEIKTGATTAATSYTPPATTAAEAIAYVAQASAALAKQDVATASIAYENALVADPANKDANFGGALTKIVMLIDDPKVKDIFLKWGVISPSANQVLSNASPIGNPFQNWTSAFQKVPSTGVKTTAKSAANGQDAARAVISSFSLMRGTLPKFTPKGAAAKSTAKTAASTAIPLTAPTVSEMQVTLSGSIIPALNEALARLKKVEGTGYSYNMTKAMQGNPLYGTDITMNDGEIYALETAISAFLCVLNVGVSYDLDVYDYNGNGTRNDYDKVSQDPLKTINQNTFFTLKPSTGAASMQAGLTALQGTVANLEKAYNVLKTRTVAQTVDGKGTFDLTNMTAQNRAVFEKFLGYAKLAVAGKTDILYNNDTKTIAVDITKFFTNPLTRNNAPTLVYDVQPNSTLTAKYNRPVAGEYVSGGSSISGSGTTQYSYAPVDSEIVPTTDIPDYTLNGILPTNTSANNVAGFNGILPVLSGKLLTGSTDNYSYGLTTDSTAIYGLSYNYLSPTNQYQIKKIDPTTGVVSVHATGSASINRLLWYNGGFYAIIVGPYDYTNNSVSTELAPVTVTNGTYTIGAATKTIPLSSNQWPSVVTGNGTDIYYALQGWNQLTYTTTTEIRKLSNLTTDTSLFTVSGYVDSLSVSNNFIYTGQEKRNLTAPYAIVATYGNFGGGEILIGGNFYSINNGKLIEKAGTPTKGLAKAILGAF